MTGLLKKAFDEASKLPPEQQDALATSLLSELDSEKGWSSAFGPNEAPVLGQLADDALEEHRSGNTQPLSPDNL